MEYLLNYLVFLGEAITLVAAILIVVAGICAIASKGKDKNKGKLTIKKLNERFIKTRNIVEQHILNKKALKAHKKADKKKSGKKNKNDNKSNLFVIKFNGDIKTHVTTIDCFFLDAMVAGATLMGSLWCVVGRDATGAILVILANRYDAYLRHTSAAVFISTLFSIVSLPIWMAITRYYWPTVYLHIG